MTGVFQIFRRHKARNNNDGSKENRNNSIHTHFAGCNVAVQSDIGVYVAEEPVLKTNAILPTFDMELPYASSKFTKEEQYQQSYDTASHIETPTSSRASLDAAKLSSKEGWTLLPPRDMRGISCAPKQKEKIRVQLNNQRESFPDSVDLKAFDLLKATGKLQSETDFRDLARLAHQLRKGTQSPMKEVPCSPSVSSRDMHQPSSIWEMGQFSANSSHAATLSQGSKESIRTTDFKDSISQHSSEKSWKDLSQSSVEASQGNPADIRELAKFAQAWRSEPKSTVQHHPYHGGIRKDPHWTARSIVKESGTYSSKTRHAISQAQNFQEAMRTIDFMDSQKAASEKAWRDVSLNSVDRSPSHSTADIRALARLKWQRRKEPQLCVREDLCDSVTSLDPRGSSSVQKTGQYSVESNHATTKPQNLNETIRATGFGDSQIWRDASQNSLDTRDQHSLSSVTSRLSVDNSMCQYSTPQPSFDSRDQSQARSIHSPRTSTGKSFSLEAILEVRSGSVKSNFSVESRRQQQSVVARLMGLELLPPDSDIVPPSAGTSSRMGKSLHNLVISTPQAEQAAPASDQAGLHKHLSEAAQYLKEVSERSHQITLPKALVTVKSRPRLRPRSRSSSPAPGQYEEELHRIGSQQLPQKASNFQQQEESGGQQLQFKQPISPKHLHVEAMPFRKLKEGHHCHLQGLHSGEMDQKLHQLHVKNATQERKTLRQILEAMYLKGLLNHKPVNIHREKSSRMQSSKPTFQDTKHLLSSMAASDTWRPGCMDLEHQDILEFQNMMENTQAHKKATPEDHCSREASIVVMKPLSHQTNPALSFSPWNQTREVNMCSREYNGSQRSTLTPHGGSEIEDLSKSSIEYVSDPSDHYTPEERVDGFRTSKRIGQKSKVSSELGESDQECGLQMWLPGSPLHGRKFYASSVSKSTVLPDPRVTCTGMSRTLERQSLHGKKDIPASEDKTKVRATLMTSKSQSSSELMRTRANEDTIKAIRGSRSEGNPATSYPQTAFLQVPSASRTYFSKVPTEVALLQPRQKPGNLSHRRQPTRLPLTPDKKTVESATTSHTHHLPADSLNSDHQLVQTQRSHLIAEEAIPPLETTKSIAASPLRITTRSSGAKPTNVTEEIQEPLSMESPKTTIQSFRCKAIINQGREDNPALMIQISSASGPSISRSQEAEVELPEELIPGVSLLKQEYISEEVGQLDDGSHHPSPVSVLETHSFQQEESSSSPKSMKSSAHDEGNLLSTGTERTSTIVEGICTSPGAAESSTLFGTNASKTMCEPCVSQFEVVMSHDINDDKDYVHRHDFKSLPFLGKSEDGVLNATSSLESQDEEYTYVKDLLVMSGLTEEASSGIINEMGIDDVCTETEDHFQLKGLMTLENREPGSLQERIYKLGVDRQLLFDCVNEILQRQIEPILSPQPWGARDWGRTCAGQPLVRQVWDELQDLHCPLLDAYNALHIILQKDFTRKEFQWLDFSVEIGEVGFQLADLVFKETLEAAVQDVTVMCTAQKCFPPQPPLLPPPPPPAGRDDDMAEKRRQELVEKTRRDLLAWHVQYQKV